MLFLYSHTILHHKKEHCQSVKWKKCIFFWLFSSWTTTELLKISVCSFSSLQLENTRETLTTIITMKKFFILRIFIIASHSFSLANVSLSGYHLQNHKNNAKRFYENLHVRTMHWMFRIRSTWRDTRMVMPEQVRHDIAKDKDRILSGAVHSPKRQCSYLKGATRPLSSFVYSPLSGRSFV